MNTRKCNSVLPHTGSPDSRWLMYQLLAVAHQLFRGRVLYYIGITRLLISHRRCGSHHYVWHLTLSALIRFGRTIHPVQFISVKVQSVRHITDLSFTIQCLDKQWHLIRCAPMCWTPRQSSVMLRGVLVEKILYSTLEAFAFLWSFSLR